MLLSRNGNRKEDGRDEVRDEEDGGEEDRCKVCDNQERSEKGTREEDGWEEDNCEKDSREEDGGEEGFDGEEGLAHSPEAVNRGWTGVLAGF